MRSDKKFNDMVHILEPSDSGNSQSHYSGFFLNMIDEAVEILKSLNVKHIHVHHSLIWSDACSWAPLPVQEIATRLNLFV